MRAKFEPNHRQVPAASTATHSSQAIKLTDHRVPARWPIRRWLGWLHLWIGLAIAIPVMLLGVTGSILAYGDDLERLFGTIPLAVAAGAMQSPQAILAAGQAAAPNGLMANRLTMPSAPRDAAVVRLTGKGRAESKLVFIDPVSLQILGSRGSQEGWLRVIHNLHANLLLDGRPGRATIGWIGTVLLSMTITGLYLWWPRPGKWRQALTVKRHAKGYRLHRDLHGVIGFWWLPWLLLTSISGLSMCFPQTIGDAVRTILPGRDLREIATGMKVTVPATARMMGLDESLVLAQSSVSNRVLSVAYVPTRPDQPWRLIFARPGDGGDLPGLTVLLDPYTGTIIEKQDPARYTLGETLLVWLKPLHFGAAAGPFYRALICLTGLSLPLFGVTGFAMWWLKRRARRRHQHPAQALSAASRTSQSRKAELATVAASGRNKDAI
jgi:uncharacterized iron-regulated membrane protein